MNPMIGVTKVPVIAGTVWHSPSILIGPIDFPTSSKVSLTAASAAVSCSSICPPGKETWPLWVPTFSLNLKGDFLK